MMWLRVLLIVTAVVVGSLGAGMLFVRTRDMERADVTSDFEKVAKEGVRLFATSTAEMFHGTAP